MTELRTVRIGDLGRVVTGKTPPSAQPELFGDDYPFVTPTDIDGIARYIEPERFLSVEGYDYQQRLMLPTHAVCVVCIGATIGKVCMTHRPSFTNQQINSVVVNENEYDPFFVYHLLTTLRDELKANAGGAATPIINKTAFSEIEVSVPSLAVQRRIASILSAYDDLIENNQRRIKILEEIARSLYREWFVHFRFPGHDKVKMVPSTLGPIPQGWEVKSLAELIEIRGGSQPPKSEFVYEEQPGYVRLIQIRDYETDSHLTFVRESSNLRLCDRADIMIARYGASVARICWGLRGAYNVALIKVTPLIKNCQEYLRQFLTDEEFQKLLIGMSGRAAQNGFNKSDIAAIRVPFPNNHSLLERFEQFAVPLRDTTLTLRDQTENLRRTRDLLLPRLLSGQMPLESNMTLASIGMNQ